MTAFEKQSPFPEAVPPAYTTIVDQHAFVPAYPGVPPPPSVPSIPPSSSIPGIPFPPPGIAYGPLHRDDQTYYAIMSGTNPSFKGKVIPKRIVAYAFMGGINIDLRGGILQPGGVTEIECYAVMGGVSIRVPPNMPVDVSGNAIIGGFTNETTRRDITGQQVMDGVRTIVTSAFGVDPFPPKTVYPEQPRNSALLVTGFATMGGASVQAN
ncbi:hypothetical protein M427DRAFT_59233 [Gonapodya prolifera JEL478]|uniref:Uncharacterized protein n=1 Tax=Gonapodya prolifera (strain JEL478) TaxID=1344416 RepID=A0A139A8I9_GONPJ|nr:hypothetical protein M427DRAFT_59233 [Gonapodya prolifera JEL478]|eukprot:KXS12703.1 hypothetical protein M427DRAFT_59233 [Gonapodya prolifera JEL478]